jgi:uncharacterized protein YcbK (DUF882 family)
MTAHEAIEAIRAILAQVETTRPLPRAELLNGNTPTPEQMQNLASLEQELQVIEAKIGQSLTINSGLRSVAQNNAAKGAPKSQHLFGRAADIRAEGMRPNELRAIIANLIEEGKVTQGGLAAYANHVHYDNRGIKARW